MRWIDSVANLCILFTRKIWYVILLCVSTPYVLYNFEEIVSFQFFSQFNGKNLIFVVWIVLLIIPLFDSFEGFGISIKRFYKQTENKQLDALVDSNEIPTQIDLEKQLKDEPK
ncbi:MAG: hypothetical protein ACI4AI_03185 [Paludibacteraceae bacterium]